MKGQKWPFIQWFVSDWLADPQVSRCEPATRGIWFDWLLNMHATDRSGQITGTRADLARLGRCTDRQVDEALKDLTNTNAADVTHRNGNVTVINRRMKREYLARKSTRFRVERHRRKASVTPHNQNQNHIPEPKKHCQLSQYSLGKKSGKLTKLTKEKGGGLSVAGGGLDSREQHTTHHPQPTIGSASICRIAREIIANKYGWAYDNCKVHPAMFPWPKSLVTVLEQFIGKLNETQVHAAWAEAVKRTHNAAVDGLANDPARYVVQCWKEALAVQC